MGPTLKFEELLKLAPKVLQDSQARAQINSAEINAAATIKAAEISLKATKVRGYFALAATIITSFGVIYGIISGQDDIKEKYNNVKKEKNEALSAAKKLKKRLEISENHVREFQQCTEYYNPLTMYFCLQSVNSKIKSESERPKSNELL